MSREYAAAAGQAFGAALAELAREERPRARRVWPALERRALAAWGLTPAAHREAMRCANALLAGEVRS